MRILSHQQITFLDMVAPACHSLEVLLREGASMTLFTLSECQWGTLSLLKATTLMETGPLFPSGAHSVITSIWESLTLDHRGVLILLLIFPQQEEKANRAWLDVSIREGDARWKNF